MQNPVSGHETAASPKDVVPPGSAAGNIDHVVPSHRSTSALLLPGCATSTTE